MRAAAPIKDWKDGTNGKATDKDNWKDGVKPGNSDVARISSGKVIVNEPAAAPLTILGLELSGTGTLEGGGTLSLLGVSGVLSANSFWTGGDVDNVTVNTSSSATFTIGAGATKNLKNGAKLNLLGNTTWSGGDVSSANGAQIANTGNFTVTGGGKIGHDTTVGGSRATFTNNGTFTKNTSADVTELESVFNNNANVTVSTGTLKLKGGGTHASSGNITVATNATLAISDSDYTFNGGAIAGSGTLEFAGATATFNGTSAADAHLKVNGGTAKFNQSHATNGRLTLSSGTLDGATGTTTSVGGLDWTGGDITTTKVTTNGTNTIGNGATKRLLNSAQLTFGGNTLWDGSTIETTDSTAILNQSGVTFSASGDGSLTYNGTGTRAVFTNDGTFTKDAGGKTGTEVQTKFDNNGTVNANGRLHLLGGGTNTGSFNIASDATVTIAGSDYTFNGGTLAGSGTLELTGATTTFNGTSGSANVHVKNGAGLRLTGNHSSTGALALVSGNVDGTGTATVGAFDWQSGQIAGANLTVTGATIGGNGTKKISDGGQLHISGVTSWTPTTEGTNDVTAGGASTKIRNTGTFTTTTDGTLAHDTTSSGRATFRNEGTFHKTDTTSGGATTIETIFENASGALVQIDGGSLKLRGGGSSSGNVTLNGGANIVLADNNYTFDGGTLAGSGSIELESATATFNGTTGTANLHVRGGNAKFSGTHTTSGTLRLESGQIEGNSTATVGNLDWSGGNITGAAVATNGTVISGERAKKISDGAQLTLSGITSWTADNILTAGNNTLLKNTGTFSINNDGTIGNDDTSANRATFRNEGTLTKTNTTSGGTTEVQTKFDNIAAGSVQIDGGKLKLTGGGTNHGTFSVANGASVEIATTDFSFAGGTLTGGGTIDITSATASFNGTSGSAHLKVNGGQAKFDGNHSTTGTLTLVGGNVTGAGHATVGSLDWQSGTLDSKVTASGATFGKNSKTLGSAADLTLLGNSTWDGSALHADGTGKLKNSSGATFTVSGDGDFTNGGTAVFTNNGTFEKTVGSASGATNLAVRFESDGEIKANTGTLKFSGGGRSSNNITLGTDATVEILGADFEISGGAINGSSGKLHLADKTTTFKNATSGSAEISITSASATAKFDGTHSGAGKLALSAGTVTGNGTAEFGSLQFTGGTLGGTIKSNGATTLGGGAKTIAGELTLGGDTSWDSSALHADGTGKIKNNATFTARGDGALTSSGSASFLNSGTFEKVTTTGGSTDIYAAFENTGEIKASAGKLKLLGGGSSSHAVTLGDGATLEISGTNYAFTGGAINGANGKLQLSSATTTFTNSTTGTAELLVSGSSATAKFDGTHTGSGKLSLTSGTVTGNGTAEFSTLDWSGGSLGAKVKSNGNTAIGGSDAKTLAGGELTLGGNTTWNGSALHASGSAKIKNEFGKTFTASADGTLTTDGTAIFTNAGTFEKTAGSSGATEVQAKFDSTGAIKATAGTLKLLGGGNASGTVEIASAGKLQVAGANYTFDGTTLSGDGTLELSGATTTFRGAGGNGKISVNGGNATFDASQSSAAKLTLLSGIVSSTNSGSAEVGALDWSGGSLTAKVKTNGATTLNGGYKALSGELVLAGNTTWDGSSLHAAGNGKIKNELGQTFTTSADGALTSDGTATFTNAGTFEKTGGAGGMTNLQARFENTGHLKATTGTVKLSGGGFSSNNVTIGNGAQLEIFGTDFAFTGGAVNGSSGKLHLASNTTTFTNSTGGDTELLLSGAATAKFDGAHIGTGKLSLASGTVAGGGTAEFGALDWSGGSLSAKVKTTGNASFSGGLKLLSGELTLNGNTTWDGSSLHASNNGKIKNESARTFSITGDGTFSSDGTATLTNAGTFEKASGAGGATHLHARLESSGTLKVTDGTLRLLGGGATSGNVTLGASGKLQILATNYAFENAAFSGNGTLELNGATTRFKGNSGSVKLSVTGGNVDLDTSELVADSLTLGSGSINSVNSGSANVGSLAWSGGALNAKLKTSGANLSGSNKTLSSGADLTLGGVTTWDGTLIEAHGNARIRNAAAGSFLATDGLFANSGTAIFANDGILTKSQGNGSLVFQTRFENNGTVNVSSGKLRLTGGGRNADNASILVGPAAELLIDGNLELAANSALTGDGLGRFLSGTLTAHGNVRLKNFSFEGGSLAGSNTFHGAVEWSGGNWNADAAGASTTIAQHASLDLRSASTHDFTNRSIFNYGTVNWRSGNLRGGNGSGFVNHAIFNDLNAGTKSLSSSSGSASFTNYGEYRKTQGGTTNVDIPFTNNGTIKVTSGSLIFNNTFINNGALNLANGASAKFSTPLTFGTDKALTGVGTIDSPHVTAAGEVAPGASPGALTLTGNLTLLNTSTLLIELGGATPGTGYDFLSVGGFGLLDGKLHVSFVNGYQWAMPAGATFTILTANGGLTGAFANVANGGRISTIDGAATFQVNYGLGASLTNSVVLSNFIVAVPEPSTYALLALGSLVVLFSVRRRPKK